jgi:hypothetical protein
MNCYVVPAFGALHDGPVTKSDETDLLQKHTESKLSFSSPPVRRSRTSCRNGS